MDNQEKYRIPTAIWVSRDGETVLRVEYTDDGVRIVTPWGDPDTEQSEDPEGSPSPIIIVDHK